MMPINLLVANRGEIAIRIMRAAAELGIRTLAIFSEDDATSLHTRKADDRRPLRGAGPTAYLDLDQIIAIAQAAGCDAIHPGYGFLSENAKFAHRCAEEGIRFIGPRPEILKLFGDKVQARLLAERAGVPVLPGTSGPTGLAEARDFLTALGPGGAMMIEVAPSPGLPPALRDRLTAAAVRLAAEVHYDNLGPFEFLVDAGDQKREAPFAFIEANPRLQVEHTVTEEVTGLDLVKLQLKLAAGYSLAELGLLQDDVPHPRGFAIQLRINLESMGADGVAKPSGGTITAFEMPSGPGLRTDTFGYAGYTTSPRFDSLLAKLIAHSPTNDFADAIAKAYRGLCEFRIEGVPTNIGFLQSLLQHPAFAANELYTRFIDDHIAELVTAANSDHRRLFFESASTNGVA